MARSINPPPRLPHEWIRDPKGSMGGGQRGDQGPTYTKKGDVVDTAHENPPCTKASIEGRKYH